MTCDCKLAIFSGASVDRMMNKVTIVLCCPEHKEALVYMDDFVRQDEVL